MGFFSLFKRGNAKTKKKQPPAYYTVIRECHRCDARNKGTVYSHRHPPDYIGRSDVDHECEECSACSEYTVVGIIREPDDYEETILKKIKTEQEAAHDGHARGEPPSEPAPTA